MNATIRRIAVSGSAAVALLGGATAITLADTGTASATEIQDAVDRATGAPVKMPDGRTVHIRGLDSAAYRADAGHHTAAVNLAATPDPSRITGGPAPDNGSGAQLQNPYSQLPANVNQQQVQTQAGGGTIAVGVMVGLALAGIVIVMVRRGTVSIMQSVVCVALGVYLAPTFVGPLVQQLGGSIGSGLGNVWAGF